MKKTNGTQYEERHRVMMEYQKEISPFTPTIREIADLWNIKSMGSVIFVLNKMQSMGMVVSRQRGAHRSYYAIKTTEVSNG